jgi:hypothetical protein
VPTAAAFPDQLNPDLPPTLAPHPAPSLISQITQIKQANDQNDPLSPQVEAMQAELVALQPQLVKTVAEVEALMARIAHDKKHEVGAGPARAAAVCDGGLQARSNAKTGRVVGSGFKL